LASLGHTSKWGRCKRKQREVNSFQTARIVTAEFRLYGNKKKSSGGCAKGSKKREGDYRKREEVGGVKESPSRLRLLEIGVKSFSIRQIRSHKRKDVKRNRWWEERSGESGKTPSLHGFTDSNARWRWEEKKKKSLDVKIKKYFPQSSLHRYTRMKSNWKEITGRKRGREACVRKGEKPGLRNLQQSWG